MQTFHLERKMEIFTLKFINNKIGGEFLTSCIPTNILDVVNLTFKFVETVCVINKRSERLHSLTNGLYPTASETF